MAGALILANLSASNIVIGKARDRMLLCAAQSMRTFSAYVYSAAGPGDSTTDLAWDGQGMVHELGELLVQSESSDAHTSELQSLMRISYAVFCLNKKILRVH